MTEAEYILVSDIRAIYCAKSCLSEICQANSKKFITKKEWQTVHRLLAKWHERMNEKMPPLEES